MFRDALVSVRASKGAQLLFHDIITRAVHKGLSSALHYSIDHSPTVNPICGQFKVLVALSSLVAPLAFARIMPQRVKHQGGFYRMHQRALWVVQIIADSRHC